MDNDIATMIDIDDQEGSAVVTAGELITCCNERDIAVKVEINGLSKMHSIHIHFLIVNLICKFCDAAVNEYFECMTQAELLISQSSKVKFKLSICIQVKVEPV